MEIYIVRHGETVWNKEKRLQGTTDIELSEAGRELAIISGKNLQDTKIDRIFSSPLKRAYETASLIKGSRNMEIETDDRIRELNFGSFEGQRYDDLSRDKSTTFEHFFTNPELFVADSKGESLVDLIKRAGAFMKDKIEPLENTCERVMIVAHGALNKAIMSYIKGHDVSFFWSGGLQKNCNVIIVDYSNGKYTIIDETKIFYEE